MSFATPTRRTFKRTLSHLSECNSSDTEEPWTPPTKRFRFTTTSEDDHFGSPSTSSPIYTASPSSPSKKRRRTLSLDEYDLTSVLKRCNKGAAPSVDAIRDVKLFPRSERDGLIVVQQLISRVKSSVKGRLDRARQKVLETELYLEWLQEFEFVVTAIENLLGAKVPGTRKRVTGLGRISFTILYQLLDEFISEVDAHHDRQWSQITSSPSKTYPQTLTIIEESQDSSTDARMEITVEEAEEVLNRYDILLADAVRRYKIECGRSNQKLADAIGGKEYAISRACCLLSEQTGFGGDDDGDSLLLEARTAMQEWKEEFGSDAPEDVGDDELASD
ncbi:hypothetical protein FA13DRAFT_1688713 [Coprinellus micaceus]|uniref:Uncharacterized protein n=1 Tax=Coprinellus micaceus TaxID=71717 RepID=A0A4Y7TAK7_COPMI|nr:hypothetical protein FA13DRAFT_1688713 [Coprinellus micaceus]